MSLSIDNLQNITRANWFTPGHKGRWGLPLIYWGPVGVGKSSVIESLAEACGLSFSCTIGSISEPSDIAGLMMPSPDGRSVRALAAPWVARVNAAGRAVQLFDEATSCSPTVQAALMQVFLTGAAGDVEAVPGVRFMAAANPVAIAANGNDLAMPLANRMGHLDFPAPDATAWADWLAGSEREIDPLVPESLEARAEEEWGAAFARARGLVGAFIRRRPGLLAQQPDANDPAASLAFPTPRTWEFATRAYAGATIHGLSVAERAAYIAAFVGEGACGELLRFEAVADLPDPVEVLDGRVVFAANPDRIDRTFAMLEMLATYLASTKGQDEPLRRKRAAVYYQIVEGIVDRDPDVVIPSLRTAITSGLRVAEIPEARASLARVSPLIQRLQGAK